jgi:ribosomal protein S18 acetylase RimI-like enzyme
VRIRVARPSDRDFILRLAPRLAEGFPLPSWRTQEEVARAESATLVTALGGDSPEGMLLVAETGDGEPVGFVFLDREIDYFRQVPHGHVETIAVAVEAEGQGVGSALLEAAERWAREQGLGWLTLNVFAGNARARQVYERHGYAPESLRYVKVL